MDAARETLTPLECFLAELRKFDDVDPVEIARAQKAADLEFERFDFTLNRLGLLTDQRFVEVWANALGRPRFEGSFPSEPLLPNVLTRGFLEHAQALPVAVDGNVLSLAVCDPLDAFTPAAIAEKTGLRVEALLAAPSSIVRAIRTLYPDGDLAGEVETTNTEADVQRLRDHTNQAPAIRYVHWLLDEAVRRRASDIHLTLTKAGALARLRIDGQLKICDAPSADLYEAVVSRIKTLSNLDPAERRLPQDGSARSVVFGQEFDFRVATMPHIGGEGVVVRVLARQERTIELDKLGLTRGFIDDLNGLLTMPHGIVLMTGPTGSGKTTTLYGALQTIDRSTRNIITIEDPVELHIDGIKQVEVNAKIGLTFSSALRAALRQDPDVILVGEIRDEETAAIAVRAAMTGHLVLASLHTNSAIAAIPRLSDMGVEPYLLASTIRAVMGQRLLRKLCKHCKDLDESPASTALVKGAYRAVGCPQCGNSGYAFRIAAAELIPMTPELEELSRTRADAALLEQELKRSGAHTMLDSAYDLVREGLTSVDEVHRVFSGSIR